MTKERSVQPPATILFWTVNDEVIERPEVLERQFHEIRESGFGGVAAFVRCSRYNWYDPLARKALAAIGRISKRHGMKSWIGPDPRFVSRLLIPASGGLEVLLFGDRARAEVFPNFGRVVDGRFSVRCSIAPRHVHTLQEVAIQYVPRAIERLYALRVNDAGLIPSEVKDISSYGHMFHNAREQYVEAFGQLPDYFCTGEWQVLAFFRASTNHIDFADRLQMEHYLNMLDDVKAEGCRADGLMWDEPGFTCTYGTLPFSPFIRTAYQRKQGKGIERDLWKLALEARDGSHIPVRVAYYEAIQRLLNSANERFTRHAKRLWGTGTISGIHDTWHFESADMCDMNHGSLDLWQAAKTKTGGFVDLGGIDKLRDPASPWNANLAAMSVICASLGKMSSGGYAYNNLWTVGDDEGQGWQATVMDHCVNTMALFGTRWLAHCYGPVGTIGEEQSFLGSPAMPGYPDHSTWRYYPMWNRRLEEHFATVEKKLPSSNVLVLFPVTSMYSLGGPRADRLATLVFNLVLALLDNHYHVDMLSTSACAGARWSGRGFVVGKLTYRAVISPLASADDRGKFRLTRNKNAYVPGIESLDEKGQRQIINDVLAWLHDLPDTRPVIVPGNCWTTITHVRAGTLVALSPSRHGSRYCGQVAFGDDHVELADERNGLTRILFPAGGKPRMLPDLLE